MPTIGIRPSTLTVFPLQRRFVHMKLNWADPWTYIPYVFPAQCREAVAPEVSSADLIYDFGRIKREDRTSFTAYRADKHTGYYVQISIQNPGAAPEGVWWGWIADDQLALDRPSPASGRQGIKAFGLEHLMDRVQVDYALALEGGVEKKLAWVPTVNERHERGGQVIGNRSSSTLADGEYGYSTDNAVWTAKNDAQALLKRFGPQGITWVLSGQADAIDQIEEVWPHEGRSLRECLDQLIDRRQGVSWVIRTIGSGAVQVHVFTLIESDVTVGTRTLPHNPMQTVFTLPSSFPYTHLVDVIPMRYAGTEEIDSLEIVGQRMVAMCTISYPDGTFTEGWTAAIEAAYLAAAGGADFAKNDAYRSTDRFARVFSAHVVKPSWGAQAGDGAGGPKNIAAATAKPDGSVDPGAAAPFYDGQKRFHRELPIVEGQRYDLSPIVDENPPGTDPQFVPLLALLKDPFDGLHVLADKASEKRDEFHGVHVGPLDHDFGVHVRSSPRHHLAKNHWAGATASDEDPVIDYKTLIVTAAFDTDQRQRILLDSISSPALESKRKRTVEIKSAQYWYAVAGTVIGVDAAGQLVRIHAANLVLRDDRTTLEAAAAFYRQWLGVRRQPVRIPIRELGTFVPLGTILTDILTVTAREPVMTPITARTIDFEANNGAGLTTIETSFVSLDAGTFLEDPFQAQPLA